MTLRDFLRSTYVPGGRGDGAYDCWGLVRHARVHLFGKELLPALDGVSPGDFRQITKAARSTPALVGYSECGMRPGAIALCWEGALCTHIGIVVEVDLMLKILETDVGTGPSLTHPRLFERKYTRVTYYDN